MCNEISINYGVVKTIEKCIHASGSRDPDVKFTRRRDRDPRRTLRGQNTLQCYTAQHTG